MPVSAFISESITLSVLLLTWNIMVYGFAAHFPSYTDTSSGSCARDLKHGKTRISSVTMPASWSVDILFIRPVDRRQSLPLQLILPPVYLFVQFDPEHNSQTLMPSLFVLLLRQKTYRNFRYASTDTFSRRTTGRGLLIRFGVLSMAPVFGAGRNTACLFWSSELLNCGIHKKGYKYH